MASVSDYNLDSLLAALIAGDAISITGSEAAFQLDSDASRRALHFYAQNRSYWASQVRQTEVDELIQALKQPLPEAVAQISPAEGEKPNWYLVRIRAHRFGGLHLHCDENGDPPPLFDEKLDYPLTVIGGFNGAGKSSLLSVIVWCLTGRALRSQDVPRPLEETVLAERLEEVGDETEDSEEDNSPTTISLPPPIVPVPSTKNLAVLNDVPADDTWVELVFRDESGEVEKTVKRSLVRSGQRYRTKTEGLDELGLNKLALEVGTVMPAVAAQMRFDDSKELGAAVAELTGFAPLVNFGAHCGRMINNQLRHTQVNKARDAMKTCVEQFLSQGGQLDAHIGHHLGLEGLSPPSSPSEDDEGAACEETFQVAADHLRDLENQANHDFQAILGMCPELPDGVAARKLDTQLTEADDALKGAELKALPSLKLDEQISTMPDEDLRIAQAAIDRVMEKAQELAKVLVDKEKAKRYQLYARVAHWHKEHHGDAAFENCPICSTKFEDVPPDAVLDKSVRDALEECRGAAAHLAQSAEKAEEDWNAIYLNELPASMHELVNKALPDWIPELQRLAYTEELFAKTSLQGTLGPLCESAKAIWEDVSAALPAALLVEEPQLPDVFSGTTSLSQRLVATAHLIALAKYRKENKAALQTVMARVVGTAEREGEETAPKNRLPMRRQLALLRTAVQNTYPIYTAKGMLAQMKDQLTAWKKQIERLQELEQAANAIEIFTRFPKLVHEEVQGLRTLLDQDIHKWVRRIYSAQYPGGPEYGGISNTDKGLGLRAELGKLTVPAHHVLNTSALRAHVWGFMLALWERVTNRHGGLGLFLLDDPQILFDRKNAEKLASAVPDMVEAGMRPIITCNDERFITFITDSCNSRGQAGLKLGFMEISPVSSTKLKADLGPSMNRIESIEKQWEENKTSISQSQNYVEVARTYLECRLSDLLASDAEMLHKPAFGDLIGKLKRLYNQSQDPFRMRPFETLLNDDALDADSEFYKVITKAKHEGIRLIDPNDANHVHEKLKHVRALVDACWMTYARWVGRLPMAAEEEVFDIQTPPPPAVALEDRVFPILGDMAAREHGNPLADAADTTETFDISELGNVALYGIRTDALGIEALTGQTVIATLDDEPRSGDLVIALRGERVLARRLTLLQDIQDQIVLETSRTATQNVAPSQSWPKYTTRTLKVIGVLFDNHKIGGREEAVPVEDSPALQSAECVATVKDDSAYPVAKDGDRVLLSPISMEGLTDEALTQLQGRIIAVEVSEPNDASAERFPLLKRLGIPVRGHPRSHVLDNVGSSTSGSGEIVHFPGVVADTSNTFPIVHRLWRVVGVLFPQPARTSVVDNSS